MFHAYLTHPLTLWSLVLGALGVGAWFGARWLFKRKATFYGYSPSMDQPDKRTLTVENGMAEWKRPGDSVQIVVDHRFAMGGHWYPQFFVDIDTGKVFKPFFQDEYDPEAHEGEYVHTQGIDGNTLQQRLEEISERKISREASEGDWIRDLAPYVVMFSFGILIIIAYYVFQISQTTGAA